MGKRRWHRVRLADLADRELQERLLGLLAQVQGADPVLQGAGPAPEGPDPGFLPEKTLRECTRTGE
jgi:hypothetical protein